MSSPRHIGIVGGGIIGSSTAFWTARLARERSLPVDITLFEASSVAAGASGKAGGLLALDWHGPSTASLAALSYRLHSELAAEYGGADRWGYRRLDTLSVSADLSSSSSSAKLSSRSKKVKGADLFPWLNKDVLTASEVLGNQDTTSQVHPEQFTRAMVEEAEKLGVKVVYGSVEGAQARADGGYDLSVSPRDSSQDRTTVPVTDVVVAAGPWTGKLLSKLGLDKQAGRAKAIRGSRAHSIVLKTAPGRELPAQALFTSIKEVGGRHAEPEVYNRPDGTSYICGPTDTSALPTLASSVSTESSAIDLLISQAARLAPDYLSTDNGQYSATVERRQACYLPVGSGDPVIGKIAQGAYVASGHSCWGICNGPGTGYVMAELLLDGKVRSADIDDLNSYSTTGYNPALGINNFPGIEGYLSTLNSSHPIRLYDLAVSGATTDNVIVNNTSDDFNTQTATFSQYFAAPNGQALVTNQTRWDPARTLFTVWMGINDIGRAYQTNQNLTNLIPAIFEQCSRNFAALYAGGARNFLVLGIPPTDQTPLVQSIPSAIPLFAAWVGQYNGQIASYANSLPSLFPGTSVFVFDTQPFFRALLASPRSYGFVDTTTYCTDYSVVHDMPELALPQFSRLHLHHSGRNFSLLPLKPRSDLHLPLVRHLPLPLPLNTHHLTDRHCLCYSYGRRERKHRLGRDWQAEVGAEPRGGRTGGLGCDGGGGSGSGLAMRGKTCRSWRRRGRWKRSGGSRRKKVAKDEAE
ncbi:hypothetical protein JCM10296v2_007893 [Rhodotorula toruloides]